jgi:hypothetical protein
MIPQMFSPIFRNTEMEIEFAFPRLAVPTEDDAIHVGERGVSAVLENGVNNMVFTGRVVNLTDIAMNKENTNILAKFAMGNGEHEMVLVLNEIGKIDENLIEDKYKDK